MARLCCIALVALALTQTTWYFPQMPAVVASHFDGAGQPNGWSSRGGFFGLYLAMVALLVVVFVYAPRLGLGRGMRIPHRDYWLAPERAAETRAWIRRQMLIGGNAHLLLAIAVMQLAIEANLDGSGRLSPAVFYQLLAYFVFLAGWMLNFFLHFRRRR